MNKIVSLSLKGVMALLLVIGVVLIWVNISLNPGSDAITEKQEFFVLEIEIPTEEGKKPIIEKKIQYNYVIDNENNVVIDLNDMVSYEKESFISSNGKTKNKVGTVSTEVIDKVVLKTFDFQNATSRSINYTVFLMIMGLIIILVFTVVNIINNPKRFLRSSIGVVILLVLYFITKAMASDKGEGKVLELKTYTDASYHMTSTSINLFLVLVVIAVILIIASAVLGLVRYISK